MSFRSISTLAAWLVVAAMVPQPSHAQVGTPFDHLKCYKVKDPTKAKYLADLVPLQQPPFQVEPGCAIKFPAKLFCIPVQKTHVQPAAPGAVNGLPAQDYLVYQIKCTKLPSMTLPVTDQFASRTVTVGNHMFLMVPAFKQSTLCHNGAAPGTPPVCGGDCTDPYAKCELTPGTTACECRHRCAIDTAGKCGGTCPATGQQCAIGPLADGTLGCTCDPPFNGCHVADPVARTCGGACTDPAAQCVYTTAGTCECTKPCGAIGIRQCGGLCQNAMDTCQMKPDDSGCECVGAQPQPCGFLPASEQCGGVCPHNLICQHVGPVPGGQCACGLLSQSPN